jgi:exonuclease SbcC
MQIKGIKLKNVKSYEYSEVPLNLGLNLIRGDNGSGKSTLQECVGHVLFDVSEHGARDQLRREGASTGTVTIRVISDQDGRVYDVVRDLKNGTLKVHDVLSAQTPLGER